jgi:hypothetical protein
MKAVEIARELGAARKSGPWWSCRCPAHDDRSPSLSLRDGDRGLIIRCWAGCDPREVLAELRRRRLTDRSRSTSSANELLDDRRDRECRIEIVRRVWNGARNARGSLVERYLRSRGITVLPPLSLRWMPSLRRPDGTHAAAMVGRVDNFDGELTGISRTWLDRGTDRTWRRRDRASLGWIAGGAVRLAPAAETLLIAEGIETALAGMQTSGLPGWAALSAGGIERLILPDAVRDVLIAVDRDANGTGERAARAAAARWLAEDRRVRPPHPACHRCRCRGSDRRCAPCCVRSPAPA